MKYDLFETCSHSTYRDIWSGRERERPDYSFSAYSGISCAFGEIRGRKKECTEDEAWRNFCWMLRRTRNFNKPVFIPLTEDTDSEHLLALFDACPHIHRIGAQRSRHGEYLSYVYVIYPDDIEEPTK